MPSEVHIMALTATASRALREQIEKLLGMVDPVKIVRSPDKVNLRFSCIEAKSNFDAIFGLVLRELQSKRTLMPRIIIFCKCKTDCPKLSLGQKCEFPYYIYG